MVVTVKTAIVNNPSSAGAILNQVATMIGTAANTAAFAIVPTSQQYQYEIIVAIT